MNITFIGTGYVGLVSGVMMSHLGHNIKCIDIDSSKIEKLKNGKVPIYEPGLDEYIAKYANTKSLEFLHGYSDAIKDSECLFITVGTPPKDDGDADLSGIYDAIEKALKHINSDCVIVLKSTVPPGTCNQAQELVKKLGYKNKVASNPEFLREGSAIGDFLEPDRIVVGSDSAHAKEVMDKVYKPLIDQGRKIVHTDLKTSELIKYASNTFLANKIAFINEMADLCEKIGADVKTLAKGIGLDNRIGEAFLKAGPGFGGSCFPKDILALQQLSRKEGSGFLILDAVIQANTNRPHKMIVKIENVIGGNLKDKKIAVLGLTFKAGTDDLRSSPAIELIKLLQEKGAKVTAYDPEGMVHVDEYFDNLNCAESMYAAIESADALVIITEWDEFKNIDLAKAKRLIKNPAIIDLRNILNPKEVEKAGFVYYSVGRKSGK